MIGGVDSNLSNPDDGILLNEVFTYEIIARGNFLDVLILQNENHVNDSANPEEFAQITIYELKNSHEGYAFSE